jgi:hypothetical protein
MFVFVAGSVLLIAGCGEAQTAAQCPDSVDVAPPSIGGASFVTGLTMRLAGPDRENSISEAIAAMRRADPALDASEITDILIAADCPNVAAQPGGSENADRARIAAFRAQVVELLGD